MKAYGICFLLSDISLSIIPYRSIHTVTNGKISFLMAEEYFTVYMYTPGANSLVAQLVKKKNLPAVQETRVQSLGQEDPLEKEMATHSSTRAWKIPRMENPGGLQSMGSQRLGHD